MFQARDELRKGMDKFLREKIQLASDAVAIHGSELISHGDVIIVYGL
jgi:hypothetical protein